MTDREMLLVLYGAMRANEMSQDFIEMLETHLFEKEKESE